MTSCLEKENKVFYILSEGGLSKYFLFLYVCYAEKRGIHFPKENYQMLRKIHNKRLAGIEKKRKKEKNSGLRS